MPRFDGSLARTLDFDETAAGAQSAPGETDGVAVSGRTGLRLAQPAGVLRGDKYKVLERRRRQAQIAARRALDLIDVAERGGSAAAGVKEG